MEIIGARARNHRQIWIGLAAIGAGSGIALTETLLGLCVTGWQSSALDRNP
jgi:hypothetical protein